MIRLRPMLALACAGSITFATLACAATDPARLLSRMRQAVEAGNDMIAGFDLEMGNAKGEVVRWTGTYYRRGSANARVRLVFDLPLDLRGTEVMTWRDAEDISHTRIYLPALRRARDIEGEMLGESFLGTDFNYEDIGLEYVTSHDNELHGENTIEGHACYRVSSRPGHGWWYKKILRFIDKTNDLPLRTEYYDQTGTLWKVRKFERVQTIQRHPTPIVISMATIPVGTWTSMTFHDVHYDTGLPANIFEIP